MKFKIFLESNELAFKIAKEVADSLHCEIGGSCVAFAEHATKKFLENGIVNFLVVEGWVKYKSEPYWHQHTWLEIDGQKIDQTFIQFKFGSESINYVNKVKKRYKPEEYLKLAEKYPEENYAIKRFIKNDNPQKLDARDWELKKNGN